LPRSSLLLILVLVFGAGTWFYIYGLIDPAWKAQRRGSDGNAYHSDLYERWLGTRLALKNHANPYDDSVTKEIQRGIYGHPLDASSTLDPHGFAYPAHVMLLLAPLALLPFAVAAPIFSVILYAMALCLMPLFMSCLGQMWNSESKWVATLVLFASFPLALALYVQQLTVFVIFVMAAGIACLQRRHLVSAGILFALSTIKPQFALLIVGWLALWSITQWRTRFRFLVSFLFSVFCLILLAEFLVSGWVLKWLGATRVFLRYPHLKLPAEWLLPGVLAQVVTAAALVPALIVLWRLRDAHPGEERFGFAVALALAATLLLLPMWPALQYNQLLLIPAVLVIVRHWPDKLRRTQWRLSTLTLAMLGFSSVGALIVSLTVLLFRIPVERLGWAELPLFNFAVVPFLFTAALIALLWNAVVRGKNIMLLDPKSNSAPRWSKQMSPLA
jgi:Glycosyltransferase family 87